MSKSKKNLIKTLVSLTFFALALIANLIWKNIDNYVWCVVYVFVYLCAGYDVIYKAVRNILKGKVFDENFLMAIASLGALALGEFSEACAVMIFYQIGTITPAKNF